VRERGSGGCWGVDIAFLWSASGMKTTSRKRLRHCEQGAKNSIVMLLNETKYSRGYEGGVEYMFNQGSRRQEAWKEISPQSTL